MNALRTRHQAQRPVAKQKSAPSLRVAREDDSATQSQAVALQGYLEAEFAASKRPTRRLRLGVSLPIVAAISGGLWIAVVAAARALLG